MSSNTTLLMDYRPAILEALGIMMKKEQIAKQPFKMRAYQKVIKQIEALAGPIQSRADLASVTGIGEKIEEKLQELFATGSLGSAQRALASAPIALYDELLKVHGIGPAKARKLVDAGVTSIADLRQKAEASPKLLDAAQRIGLKHYENFLERIPRAEMEKHERRIRENLLPHMKAELVGSYRRGQASSGDIDVLVTAEGTLTQQIDQFRKFVQDMRADGYITDILALGDHKCMAVSIIEGHYRRLDLLLTPLSEFAFALLYFTGSDRFNVAMRTWALEAGWSLNEHGLTRMKPDGLVAPLLRREEDIFAFLGLEYVPPTERTGPEKVVAAKTITLRRKTKA